MKEKKKFELNEATLEIIVAVFLAITALLTAWASWIGSLHGGNQATNYSKSNNYSADGNSRYNEASQKMMQDMLLWNDISDLQYDILFAQDQGDMDALDKAAYKLNTKCFENLSEEMAAQIGFDFDKAAAASDPTTYILKWMDQEEALTSPFTNEDFIDNYYVDAMEVLSESEALLEEGQRDNANGDSFNLVTVFYSVVLFLLGIAGTFKKIPNRTIIVAVSIVCFLIATIYMFTIPMPTGFNFASFFSH